MTKRLMQYGFIVCTMVFAAVSLSRILAARTPDFAVYYQSVTQKIDNRLIADHWMPPIMRVAYLPIGLLPYQIAQTIWVLASLVGLWISVRLTLRMLNIYAYIISVLFFCVAFLSFPVRFTLAMGQVNLIALALLVLAVYFETRSRSLQGGVLWGAAMLLKPELSLLNLAFVLAKRWLFCLTGFVVLVTAGAMSVLFWGVGSYVTYGERVISQFGILQGREIYYNQSLSGLIARLGSYPWLWVMYLGLSALIIALALWWVRLKKIAFPAIVWLSLPVFLFLEPIAWQHHFVFLIPTYLWLWQQGKRLRKPNFYWILFISYFLVSWNIKNPLHWQQGIMGAVALSHVFWGNVILIVLIISLTSLKRSV